MAFIRTILIGVVLIGGVGALGISLSPVGKVLIPTGVGISAKQLCSLVFVSRLDAERAWDLYVDPLLGPAFGLVSYSVDEATPAVTARALGGLYSVRAVHRPGLGCTLVHDDTQPLQPTPALDRDPVEHDPMVMTLDVVHQEITFDQEQLDAALEKAFTEPGGPSPRNTLAVVVLHDHILIAERYAPGITPDTPLPGWSMTKSVTATLAGILEHQNRLDVEARGALAKWRDTDDPRQAITLDQLLRMTSGLDLTETQDGFDENSQMLFIEPDAAAFAADRPLQKPIGSHYEYMSGNTVLAMARVQEVVGRDLGSSYDFIHRVLFEPLSMKTAVIEPDQAGTFIGSSFMLASARDWASLGQLYLDGGKVGDEVLFDPEWVDYVTRHTTESAGKGYGSGFWLLGERREAPSSGEGLPQDAYFGWGFQGQYLFIIPSENLVIVRLGATNGGDSGTTTLVKDIVAALHP